MVIHQIWIEKIIPQLTFEELIEKIKRTPFNWNPDIKFKVLLQHITYIFNLDINIVMFKKNFSSCQKCERKRGSCSFLCYIFQNTFIKLFSNNLKCINILQHQQKYYLIKQTDIYPCLITKSLYNNITIDNYNINYFSLKDIITRKSPTYPFNINLYTAYEFVTEKYPKKIFKNLLGKYFNSENNKTVNLFISCSLNRVFQFTILPDPTIDKTSFSKYPSLNTLTERKKIKIKQEKDKQTLDELEELKEKTVLNQENCICEHPLTKEGISLPENKSFKSLAAPRFQKFLLYENLLIFGFLDDKTKKILKICSEISFLSFDTESLNKGLYNNVMSDVFDDFANEFNKESLPKIDYGIQQLYTIGLVEIMPIKEIFQIFEQHLPKVLFLKLKKYTTSDYNKLRSSIKWDMFKSKLKKLNLIKCAQQLTDLLESVCIKENNVKIFHISQNHEPHKCNEPSIEKTCKMVYQFLTYIYQRNVLASLIKYILLQNLINKFETFVSNDRKGIFLQMKNRLNEIVFEFVLTAFNGSNYDNILICNSLLLIHAKLNQKIKIFKKGASISTIILNYKKNFQTITDISKLDKKLKIKTQVWPINIYIKDIRNLVSSNLSLDKLGKLFNLPVSKLCFPYDKATSIKILKSLTSLDPFNDEFWRDSFSNKKILLDDRIKAQQLFEDKKFLDLYQYSIYYLKQDCILLHSIVLTLFNTYLFDDINIFIRRNFSQSSLSYQQFFIIDPSRQIDYVLAPKKINNIFLNYFIKQAVTGGLCTSFVQGNIDKNTKINEHFNYLDYPNLNPQTWPNFSNLKPWEKFFNETPSGINTVDIRSLYPSAAIKKIPINSPLLYSRFTKEDYEEISSQPSQNNIELNDYCKTAQNCGSIDTDCFKLLNKAPRFFNEYYALKYYLNSLPKNIKILRFQSSFTALGQLYLGEFCIDGFLAYKENKNNSKIYIKIIQYNSVFFHGHKDNCSTKNNEKELENLNSTKEKTKKILFDIENFKIIFNLKNIDIEYVEISDCDFFLHKIPKDNSFLFSYKKSYTYKNFLNQIYDKKLTGFLVVKNLEIKKTNQNPIFGFIIQKVQYDLKHLSPLTQEQLKSFNSSLRVVSINKSKSFMVISTEYFTWLNNTFKFEKTPEIYHALLFQTDNYLKPSIENKLLLRKNLKILIKNEKNIEKKQNYEIRSELIKLMLNSCYGFTLCNLTSSKFKMLTTIKKIPRKTTKARKKIISSIELNKNFYLVEKKKTGLYPFETMLGHVGCAILFHSKIILLKRLYFLLKYLNPKNAQLLYMDTDSAHFLVKYKNFIDNVDSNLQPIFKRLYNKHFETGNKISGIWVEEGFFNSGNYIGEKCYTLFNEDKTISVTHMKGLNSNFQNRFVKENIDKNIYPFISYNNFLKTADFIIYKSYFTKNIFSNYVPIKRYFISFTGSLPLKL